MNVSPPKGSLSAIKLALLAKQARAQAGQSLRSDPIAVIGIGCRLPGGAASADEMWRLLSDGVDCVRTVPADRWDTREWYDPDPAAPGKLITEEGGFLDRIDMFDAGYFGILPREADRMDPQQRLVLEVAVEAIDDAGLPHPQLRGSSTSVYIASYHNDYAQLQLNDPVGIDARTLTGTLHSVVPNRLSYLLDLRGPSISIDSACSSSLAAIHLACQGLRSGETNLAFAGGVSLMVVPELSVAMSKVGFMAPDGRCKTFDASANGFGRGEGCGIVVLKRLSDAIADNDRIHAVIRGSAVNQDGRSTLLAAPNGPAQEALIRESLQSAQLDAGRICFFETHGTGTALGDPIEVEAIAATIGRSDESAAQCWLGSAKANFGHLEAAAGVVGLIKAIQVLRHGMTPPQPHFTRLNPHISVDGTRLAISTALRPLPKMPFPRCAAVSSFGVGGTNANVIVEEAPSLRAVKDAAPADACRILPLSARSLAALEALVKSWTTFLGETPAAIDDLCCTAALHRTHYDDRVAVTGHSKDELRAQLVALSTNTPPPVRDAAAPRVGFVFSGQGPQWFAMGRELLKTETLFREVIASCDELLRPLASWSLLDELNLPEEKSRLAETEFAQPALFAIEVGLAALWKSWGISPDCVIGHSVGEIAALHVAGALDLPEAMRVVFHRARIMQRATGNGRMAAVSLDEEEAARIVAPYGSRLDIGASNGPRSVVLSGETAALDEVVASLQKRDVNCRMLPVNYAFHSAQMASLRDEFVTELGHVRATEPSIEFISTVSGKSESGRLDAAYFGRNVREPVRFAAAAKEMLRECNVVVEIGPHPVLAAVVAECAAPEQPSPSIFASLRRGRPERETMLKACAGVYAAGRDVNWKNVQVGPGEIVDLPSYPWQRRRHWIPIRNARASQPLRIDHPLLGQRTDLVGLETSVYQGDNTWAPTWLADHVIGERVLLPAAAVMEAFCAAGARSLGKSVELVGFAMHRPLAVPQDGQDSIRWQVVIEKMEDGRAELQWHASRIDAASDSIRWHSIANAVAQPVTALPTCPKDPAAFAIVPTDLVYAQFSELGAQFGTSFRCLRHIERADGFARASIELPQGVEVLEPEGLHPGLIDATIQLCLVAAGEDDGRTLPQPLYLPIGADRTVIYPGVHRSLMARVRARKGRDGTTLVADIWMEGPSGAPAMIVEGMRFARAELSAFREPVEGVKDLYRVGWAPVSNSSTQDADASGTWLIFADNGGTAVRFAEKLRMSCGRTVMVTAGDAYRRTSMDEFVLDPAAPEDIGRLFLDGGWSDTKPLRAVIDCWPLDLPRGTDRTPPGEDDPGSLGTETALRLVKALAKTSALTSGSLILVSRGGAAVSEAGISSDLCPRAAGLWGMVGVIAIEHPDLRVRIVDLDPHDGLDDVAALYSEGLHRSDARIALRAKQRWAPRLLSYSDSGAGSAEQPFGAVLSQPGTFDGVDLLPRTREHLRADEVRLKVLAAGLNFRDVLLALGLYPGSGVPVGAECAGVVVEAGSAVSDFKVGDAVFGYAPGSLATEAVVPARWLALVPAGMSAATAASLPVACLTALYGLKRIAGLKKGQSVLIHAAAGGVGFAALQIAKHQGAEIFATAGSEEKRELLLREGAHHVLNSRSLDFADEVHALTEGRGVDVVLNSLAGDFIPASLRSLANSGWFLELGKRDIWSSEAVAAFRPDIKYLAYDLGEEIGKDPKLFRDLMDDLLRAFSDHVLLPRLVNLFPLERVRDAMRYMAQARHVGKIVLTTQAGRADPAPGLVRDGTYWITGGLGGLGKETARWLARRGARHLVLTGRHADKAANGDFLAELSQSSVSHRIFDGDAADRRRMSEILDEIRRSMPPLRGVIHTAGIVRDAALINQNSADADEIRRGKVEGAWILHELTRDIPLDFFVLYSAAGVVLGAPGQGMYAAANAELDALAEFRHSIGLPATSVAWGPWSGAGMAADLVGRGRDVFTARGLAMIGSELGFSLLERLLVDGSPYGAVIPVDWTKFLSRLPDGADREYYSMLTSAPKPGAAVAAKASPSSLERLKAIPAGQRRDALAAELASTARQVIGLDDGAPIASTLPLREVGLDSLMAVELRNVLVRLGGQSLPATLLFDYPHLDALSSHLYRIWGLDFDVTPALTTVPSDVSADDDLADLSDEEAESLLLAELANGDGLRRRS
jgi:acyl transferase domain-containing protein/NADPH:quinone reductase-like Zn-dependent oxidoreductase